MLLSPRLRFLTWTLAVPLLLLGQLLWLVLLRGPRLFHHDALLIAGQCALGALILLFALLLRTTPPNAIKLRRGTSELLILAGVIGLQSAGVVLLRPGLSADVLRYRVDGRTWLGGTSPYATAPLDWPGTDAVDSLVPFPDMTTIYPPTAQASFAFAAAIERALDASPAEVPLAPAGEPSAWRWYLSTQPDPYRAIAFRATFAAAIVLGTAAALLLLRRLDQSPWWATLLAWNPLVTLEIGGMGHVDALGVLLVIAALLALSAQRHGVAGACLALATAVKPIGLLLLPFALRDARSAGGATRMTVAFVGVALLLVVPPLLPDDGLTGWRQTLTIYSEKWEANGSIYELIVRPWGERGEGWTRARAKEAARGFAVLTLVATAVLAWRSRASVAAAGYALCLAGLLVAPVVYPWYLIWPLCFVPFLRGRAGWSVLVWSATVGMSYLLWRSDDWQLGPAPLLAQYVPVYAAVAYEVMTSLWGRRNTNSLDAERATAPALRSAG